VSPDAYSSLLGIRDCLGESDYFVITVSRRKSGLTFGSRPDPSSEESSLSHVFDRFLK